MRVERVRSAALTGGTRLAALAVASFALAVAGDAGAFCRTTTCGLPANFSPSGDQCHPDDYASWCASQSPSAKILPVYWSNACVSYDVQQNASIQVPYATAVTLVAGAFARWTGTACAGIGSPSGNVSIAVDDLGPVACNKVQYSSNQGNQHVIIFHDDVWPHDDASNTLGLTTITFDPDTGEIYDADTEINSTPSVPLSLADPVPPTGYDFQSIITHEAGHFLGMAHSGEETATMFAHYMPGTTSMRTLSQDDKSGLCTIYPPDGTRSVDPSVEENGVLQAAACDPTPRHGFQSVCAQPKSSGCALAPGASGRSGTTAVLAAALVLLARGRRRTHV
jgi:hypothetical protein